MTTTKKKPPTQVAGVSGIADIPIVLTPEQPEQAIDWVKLFQLPTFQMFAVECEPALAEPLSNNLNNGVPLWVQYQSVDAWLHTYHPEDLYKQYCAWHKSKGHWPNETPMGDVL